MEILRRETDYAMRALIKVSGEESLVSTRYLSEACGVSLEHIRKIMPKLAQAGLVVAVRGARGGFRLARPAPDIHLNEIIEAVQGPLKVNKCTMGDEGCERRPECSMVGPVRYLQERLDEMTRKMTLKDLAEGKGGYVMGVKDV